MWYVLSLGNSDFDSSVAASNYFYETEHFDGVDPGFMFDFSTKGIPNDERFSWQWGLYDPSPDIPEINVLEAWETTRGAGTVVAIVDSGIDISHRDLSANIHNLSFDALSGTSPSVFLPDDSHGTHVAGIVGAVRNNGMDVVGVAPETKIMDVSHPMTYSRTATYELAMGISWAWQNGADVINNSWGDQGGLSYWWLHSTVLEDAIMEAMESGRDGKGCVVVFASGNYGREYPGVIDYPGNYHPDILTVGAIDRTSGRADYSSFGDELDVVAPGSIIYSTLPGNSVGNMKGTSMAAPHAAGVAALILSQYPDLSYNQVTDIIESTAQKIGNYSYDLVNSRDNGTWSEQTGYGLIDADAALFGNLEIDGRNAFPIWDTVTYYVSMTDIQRSLVTFDGWTVTADNLSPSDYTTSGLDNEVLSIRLDVYQKPYTITARYILPDGSTKSCSKEIGVNVPTIRKPFLVCFNSNGIATTPPTLGEPVVIYVDNVQNHISYEWLNHGEPISGMSSSITLNMQMGGIKVECRGRFVSQTSVWSNAVTPWAEYSNMGDLPPEISADRNIARVDQLVAITVNNIVPGVVYEWEVNGEIVPNETGSTITVPMKVTSASPFVPVFIHYMNVRCRMKDLYKTSEWSDQARVQLNDLI